MNNSHNSLIPTIYTKSKQSPLLKFVPTHSKDNESYIDQVIATLQLATQAQGANHSTQDVSIPTILETLLDRVRNVVEPGEKLVWISKNILQVLIKTICLNTRRSQSYSIAVEVCRQLISDNREACTVFARLVLTHITSDTTCTGVSECLHQLINISSLKSVLIEELGVPTLLDVYASIKIEKIPATESIISDPQLLIFDPNDCKADLVEKRNESAKQQGQFNRSRSNSREHESTFRRQESAFRRSPSVPINFLQQQSDSPPLAPRTPPLTATSRPSTPTNSPPPMIIDPVRPRAVPPIKQLVAQRSQSPTPPSSPLLTPTSSTRPFIPALKLPFGSDSGQTSRTRSGRREKGEGSGASTGRSSLDTDFEPDSEEQLGDLAKKLGETYMATDLTALLSYKQAMDAHACRAKFKKSTEEPKRMASKARYELASNAYKVKSSILKVLIELTSQPSLLRYIRSPVNILYTELIEVYQSGMPVDAEIKNLIYQLLCNWAEYTEYLHKRRLCEITKGMSAERKIRVYKKLDEFLWRVHNNIVAQMEAGEYAEVNVHLAMLVDYMSNCPTRTMSAQVVNVCMETLLKMKHLVFTRGKFTTLRPNDFRMMHNMLAVFDEVARQNTHAPLNDLLLALFVERDDTLSHIKDYVSVVLFSSSMESESGRDAITLTDYRERAISHFEVCVDMIRQQAENSQNQSDLRASFNEDADYPNPENPSSSTEILLSKLDFLLKPSSGYILRFLQLGSHFDNFSVKKRMLQLLCKIFELKGNPFVRKKSYVDTYVSYFYIRFIKLYQSPALDQPNMEKCQLYLRLLLAFSLYKTDRVAMKFYQLKTMDFLVREISLEYEVKLNRESKDVAPFCLSAKLQKTKAKAEPTSFPPPPVQVQSPQIVVNPAGTSEKTKPEQKPATGLSLPLPPTAKRLSVNLSLNLKGLGVGAPVEAPAKTSKSMPLLRMPSRDLSSTSTPSAPLPTATSTSTSDTPAQPPTERAENLRYSEERNNRKIYHAKDLHIAFLQLILSMMLTHKFTLDPLYNDQFPGLAKKLNIPYILHLHINHPQNEVMVSELVSATQAMGTPYFRLLKLLFSKVFNPKVYSNLERVATGAYGTVYKTKLPHIGDMEVAVKKMTTPNSITERCVLHDIFTEILILEKFKNDSRCCQMYDYGVDNDSYWIVMKSYKCSLKMWRQKQTAPFAQALPLYLNIFSDLLTTMKFLVENKVNHFDIKCDNFLIHPKHPGISEQDFWSQPSSTPNFNVCLADFGEAKIYSSEADGYTRRNRGTELIKSPEMLSFEFTSQKNRDAYDRRKHVGSNSASDVWSIGCLFYELLAGEFLFYNDDRFPFCVTAQNQTLLTEEKKAKLGNLPPLFEFLEFIFIRNQFYRPTIHDVITRFRATMQHLTSTEPNTPPQPKKLTHALTSSSIFLSSNSLPPVPPSQKEAHPVFLTPSSPPQPAQPKKPSQQWQFTNCHVIPPEPEVPEHEYFARAPSQITPYLYVSSYTPSLNRTMLKHKLHITHIINCTESPNAFPDHFEYLRLKLHDKHDQDILDHLPQVFDFIRDGLSHRGRVLIFSDKGISRSIALCIAYLMDSYNLTYFEAYLYVEDRRYISAPNPGFVAQLCKWHTEKHKKTDTLFAANHPFPLELRENLANVFREYKH